MKKYVNDPDDPKTDSPAPVPHFIHAEIVNELNKMRSFYKKFHKVLNWSDAELRLHGGEMTAQEIRTVRAILNLIKGKS
jgi:hypothetical protein